MEVYSYAAVFCVLAEISTAIDSCVPLRFNLKSNLSSLQFRSHSIVLVLASIPPSDDK